MNPKILKTKYWKKEKCFRKIKKNKNKKRNWNSKKVLFWTKKF